MILTVCQINGILGIELIGIDKEVKHIHRLQYYAGDRTIVLGRGEDL